jgi:hypothetical protein
MGAAREWFDGFDPGEFLGLGLDTSQIGHLAGALFLALFGLSALRRVTRAAGPMPAVWMAVAIGLLAGAVLVAARGFPDQVPEDVRPWTNPDRMLRGAAVLGLLGVAATCLSAHWVRRPAGRAGFRLFGMLLVGMAVWLAAGWFANDLPEEARPWAGRPVVTRGLVILGLVGVAAMFWVRPAGEVPHRRWASRTLAVPAIGLAVVLAARWFGASVLTELAVADVVRVTGVVTLIATGTSALVTVGAYWLRPRPENKSVRPAAAEHVVAPLPLAARRRLPVAILLDDQGRPIIPAESSGGGPAGL